MYGLAENTDLSFLKGKQLLQVCIGCNEVILHFDRDLSINAQTDIGHSSGKVLSAVYKTPIAAAPVLVRFLHESVVNASVVLPGTLILEFSNGEGLEIHDASSQYESYQINYDGKTIVV
jgi:hypothetical protein